MKDIHLIDLSVKPKIYRLVGLGYQGSLCVDFSTEHNHAFLCNNLQELKTRILELFGNDKCKEWFPNGITDELPGGKKEIVVFNNQLESQPAKSPA